MTQGRLPRWVATVLTVVALVAGAAVSLDLWWAGARPPAAPAEALLGAGRATGLLGAYLLLVEVALVARTPWLETRVGADRVLAWHRGLGESVVVLLVVHAVLLVVGYALAREVGVWAQTLQVVLVFPGALTATVGTVLLVLVGVSSLRVVRSRWRWERWHAVHLLAYVGLGLGFAHQLWLGESLVGQQVAVAWTGAHAVVAGAVLWSRVLTPLRLSGRHRLRVTGVVDEGPDAVSVHVGGRWLAGLAADPGQSFRWRFLAPGLWWQAHPYSLSAAPSPGRLRITVRTTGDHGARLARVRPGTPVVVEGPSGALGEVLRGRRPLLLIAGGVGVTPLRALLDAPAPGGTAPVLLQRAARADDLLFAAELADLAARGRVRHVAMLGPTGDPSTRSFDGATLRALVPDLAARTAVVCGPPAMVRAVRAGLREAGVARRHVHAERFRLA